MTTTLHTGDCLDVLRGMEADSADSIVTDPPYGLSFMGKAWDKGVPGVEVWREALRVLKPGGHLLSFAGTRTQHRMATAIEDAGFEIRDMIAWVYGSGFPKSLNVSKAIDKAAGAEREVVGARVFADGTTARKTAGNNGIPGAGAAGQSLVTTPATSEAQQWDGWGTALKPALEPITVARKPLAKGNTVAANVLAHGTGALNVDGCRVATEGGDEVSNHGRKATANGWDPRMSGGQTAEQSDGQKLGRWPANLIHDGSDEVVGLFPVTHGAGTFRSGSGAGNVFLARQDEGVEKQRPAIDSRGSTARFFYCAKASKKDREEGNVHPTVKPTDLMAYLCRLVTPPGGVVLDPFMGSGSTGKACVLEGFAFVGIDVDPNYVEIARARIAAAQREPTQEGFDL